MMSLEQRIFRKVLLYLSSYPNTPISTLIEWVLEEEGYIVGALNKNEVYDKINENYDGVIDVSLMQLVRAYVEAWTKYDKV